MTLQQIIELIGTNPKTILTYYLIIVALAVVLALFVNKDNFKSPFTYIYSVLVYAVSIPAVVSVVLVIYGFFFRKIVSYKLMFCRIFFRLSLWESYL